MRIRTPVTPEGILVYTASTAKPSFIADGQRGAGDGQGGNTFPTTGLTPGTEIDGPQTFTLLSTGNPLPTPVTITAGDGFAFGRSQAVLAVRGDAGGDRLADDDRAERMRR